MMKSYETHKKGTLVAISKELRVKIKWANIMRTFNQSLVERVIELLVIIDLLKQGCFHKIGHI